MSGNGQFGSKSFKLRLSLLLLIAFLSFFPQGKNIIQLADHRFPRHFSFPFPLSRYFSLNFPVHYSMSSYFALFYFFNYRYLLILCPSRVALGDIRTFVFRMFKIQTKIIFRRVRHSTVLLAYATNMYGPSLHNLSFLAP
jgi:hypothetical protein